MTEAKKGPTTSEPQQEITVETSRVEPSTQEKPLDISNLPEKPPLSAAEIQALLCFMDRVDVTRVSARLPEGSERLTLEVKLQLDDLETIALLANCETIQALPRKFITRQEVISLLRRTSEAFKELGHANFTQGQMLKGMIEREKKKRVVLA